ncbi:MAG: TlpA family protein disulfide reductase [Bacteroidaceae bacterium]|nr:TlpA family protein disulfide reductase [Bacteroidaceae bacterium]
MKSTHLIMTIASIALLALSCYNPPQVDSLWQKEFNTAQEIINTYIAIDEKLRESDKERQTKNLCHYIWNSGEYMFKCRGKNEDIALLPENIEELALDDDIVKSYMIERDTARFADHYFTLKAMKRGCSFDDSRDGITITVFYPIRGINDNDYRKLQEVFSCKNDALHIAYMKKLKFPFRNSGCNAELNEIRPLIEKNVKESRLKQEIMELYNMYGNIVPGMPAPNPVLKDTKGNEYTFAEFRGKVLVVDVWATWCSSCLAKMPDYMALRESYKENKDIEFITVSIDRRDARNAWLNSIEKRGMSNMLNLTPDCEEMSQFECDYHISGVPRYIVIGKDGNIISAYAPPPGSGLKEIISKSINN